MHEGDRVHGRHEHARNHAPAHAHVAACMQVVSSMSEAVWLGEAFIARWVPRRAAQV